MSSGAERVIRWGRAQRTSFLMRDLYTFAKHTSCPDIEEEPYREVCEFLESMLPNTAPIAAWRARTGRPQPPKWEQDQGIFMMPRLTLKTSLLSAACIYNIALDRDVRLVLGRATTTDAESTLDGIKTTITGNPDVRAVFGELGIKFSGWTSENITVADRKAGAREPTIDTTGLNTSKTGSHPDGVFLDDLVHENNYLSTTIMEQARRKVQAFYPIVERWGSLLVQGTMWGDNDLCGSLLEQDHIREQSGKPPRWRKLIWGAYKDDGKVRFPSLLPEARLEDLRGKTDPKMFSSWYLNVSRTEGENIFPLSSMRYFEGDFTAGPFSELRLRAEDNDGAPIDCNLPLIRRFGLIIPMVTVITIDPAPTVGPTSDFTGICVTGFDRDANWWVLYADEIKKLPHERLELIEYLARRFSPRIIASENADMDMVLLQDRMRDMGLNTQVVSFDPRMDRRRITADAKLAPRGFTKKEAQIEATQQPLRAGRIFMARGETRALVRRMTQYPYVDHDDVLDAFSMTKAYEQKAPGEADQYAAFEKMMEKREKLEYARAGIEMYPKTPVRVLKGGWAGPSTTPMR